MTEFTFDSKALDNLKGKVVIVTGGSSGIGKGTVEYFSSHGAKVVAADVNPSQSLPKGATFQKCNVKVWSDIVNLFRETRKLHGSVDIVCANAGIADREDLLGDDEEEPAWDVLDVNLKGVMMTCKAAAHHFRKNNPVGGVIVMTGSITSFVPAHEGVYVYSAAKYAVLGMLRSMRLYLPKLNSRINLVAPYLTDTGMRQQKNKEKDYYNGQPVNQPADIAKAIAALAADDKNHGKAVVCVGKKYYETEEPWARLLPEIVSTDVTDNWTRVLEVNPFKHMADKE